MENMIERINRGDIKLERAEAIKVRGNQNSIIVQKCSHDKAMCDIAVDRATKLQ